MKDQRELNSTTWGLQVKPAGYGGQFKVERTPVNLFHLSIYFDLDVYKMVGLKNWYLLKFKCFQKESKGVIIPRFLIRKQWCIETGE